MYSSSDMQKHELHAKCSKDLKEIREKFFDFVFAFQK